MSTESLLQIAQELEEIDPISALELRKSVAAIMRTSVINPGAQKFEDHVEKTISVLKSLVQELDKGLEEIDSDDAEEFAKFFTDVVDAEREQLKSILDQTKALKTAARLAARYAGPLDFVKNIFKKDKPAEDKSEHQAPYSMKDSEMDDFVEGGEWSDSSKYIEKEWKENKEFFDGVSGLLTQFDRIKKTPTRELVESLKEGAQKLIKLGEGIVKGIRKTLDHGPKVEVDDTAEIGKPGVPSKKEQPSPKQLQNTVEHYVDMLKNSLGDEKKTVKFLKELFHAVGPLVEDERATLAAKKILPVLVRTAHATPKTRLVLIPVIRRIANASTTVTG